MKPILQVTRPAAAPAGAPMTLDPEPDAESAKRSTGGRAARLVAADDDAQEPNPAPAPPACSC